MVNVTARRWVGMLGVLLLLATACGGGEEPAAEPTDAAATPETEPDAATPGTAAGADDGQLHLGYILPQTGGIAFLGPGMIGSVELAVQEINEAGGVLGQEVLLSGGDEGESDGVIAAQSADRLLADGVHAIIGAAASGVSFQIIDKITGSGVVQCAPSNTSPDFTDYDDNGYYFRAAPSDLLQGPVLAEVIVGDGNTRIALMARADDYGTALIDAAQSSLEEQGAEIVARVVHDPMAQTFDGEIQEVVDADPDGVLLIAFDEGARILQGLIEQGYGPQDINIYGGSGSRSADLPASVNPDDPGVLAGMKGVSPAATTEESFLERLRGIVPDLEVTLFTAQSYDCPTVVALAAEQAGSTDPADIRDNMVSVTRDGTKCTSFAECKELLDAGEDIDYDGVSGPLEFSEVGDPTVATYDVWQFTEEGEITTIDTLSSSAVEE